MFGASAEEESTANVFFFLIFFFTMGPAGFIIISNADARSCAAPELMAHVQANFFFFFLGGVVWRVGGSGSA